MNAIVVTMLRRANARLLRILCAVALCAVGTSAAMAQEDLPGRVGRVADVGGELFLAPEDKPDGWNTIGLNYPITNGDNLWVGNNGRAEIDFGGGQFRLGADTNLHMSRLDDRQFALFVAQGLVGVRVRSLDPGESARVDTPNAQVVIVRPGLYRIDVSDDREHTHVVVREGEVNVLTAGGVQQVLPGQSADIDGADARFATVQNGIGSDGFDTWVASRDRYYATARNGNNVSPQMVGAADLAQYGTWSQAPDVGAVWYPNDVPNDWAPYRNGYWVDVGGFGPTWVDYAPWGYAPFHYGRWAYIGGRWGWSPGAYVARPRWAPAFVAWTGGSGWSISASAGGPVYGWVPLAWGEPYRPWWGRCSYGCWERYNRPYAVNVSVWRPNSPPPREYRNWNQPGGITAMSSTAFATRQPVQQNLVRVPRDALATAPVMVTAPSVRIEPTRSAVQRPVSAPPPASTFARQTPATGSPNAFNRGTAPVDSSFSRGRPAPTTPPPSSVSRQSPSASPFTPSNPSAAVPPSQPRSAPSTAVTTPQPGVRQPTLSPQPQALPPQQQQAQQPGIRQPQALPPQQQQQAQPGMRQPQALPQTAPQALPQPQQPSNAMRSRQQPVPPPQAVAPGTPPQQFQQQPTMRAAPQPVPQVTPQPMPQRVAPAPLPQPHVAPQVAPPQPQPRAAPQPQGQPQSRAVPDQPDNPGANSGGERRGR